MKLQTKKVTQNEKVTEIQADQDANEANFDFWSTPGITMSRIMLFQGKKLSAPKDNFPIPFKFIDVEKQTDKSLDVLQEKSIDDYWKVDVRSVDWSFTVLESQ